MKKKSILTSVLLLLLCFFVSMPVTAAPKISKKKTTLIVGQTIQLKVKGTKSRAKWSSSRKSVASVSSKGKVQARKKGTAQIYAKVGKKKYTCYVTVEKPQINKTSVKLTVGKTTVLKIIGTKQKVKWSSSNKNIVSVNSNGKIKAIKSGTCRVYAKIGKKRYSCTVSVKSNQNRKVTSIKMSQNSVEIPLNTTYKLNCSIEPKGISKNIVWESSNSYIATVDQNGVVKGLNDGVVIITASCDEKTTKCLVTVNKNAVKNVDYKITYEYFNVFEGYGGDADYQSIIEIENIGNVNLYLGNAVFDIYDNTGRIVASEDFISNDPSVIAPGEKGYFYNNGGSLDVPVGDYHMLPTLDIEYTDLKDIRYPVTGTYIKESDYGGVSVVGTVTNTSDEEDSLLWIAIVLFDANDCPIGIYGTNIMNVKAGSTRGFDANGLFLPDYVTLDKVAKYEVIAAPTQYQFS